jgi:hypothetical protein
MPPVERRAVLSALLSELDVDSNFANRFLRQSSGETGL